MYGILCSNTDCENLCCSVPPTLKLSGPTKCARGRAPASIPAPVVDVVLQDDHDNGRSSTTRQPSPRVLTASSVPTVWVLCSPEVVLSAL